MCSDVPTSANDKVLNDIISIYEENELGLRNMSSDPWIKKKVFVPNKKIKILLVGSHSSGKSSFINWFYGDNIQRVSKSIETDGFNIITTGKTRQTLKSDATINYFDFLKECVHIPTFVDNLSTIFVPQIEPRSALVTMIDSPGLVDERPSSVEALLELCNHVDLVFCLIEPINQAFCKKLQQFLSSASKTYKNKLHYFLTKSDSLLEKERTDILASITQSISQCVKEQNIKIRLLSIPGHGIVDKESERENEDDFGIEYFELQWVIDTIAEAVTSSVQDSIRRLENDNNTITRSAESAISKMKSRYQLFYISFIFFSSVLAYTLAASYSSSIYFYKYLYHSLFGSFVMCVLFYVLTPSRKRIRKMRAFLEGPSRIAKSRIKDFYRSINESVNE